MSICELEVNQSPMEVKNLKARMLEIQQKLIDGTPGIVDAMIDIHTNLQQHEELVMMLDDEDIHMLHLAHEKHKQVHLIVKAEKELKKGSRKKLSSSDLANL